MSYNPSKMYQWKSEDTFTLSGTDFGLILNTIRAILNTEQAQQILLAARTSDVLEKIMEEAVKSGKVIEKEEPNGNKEEKLDKICN